MNSRRSTSRRSRAIRAIAGVGQRGFGLALDRRRDAAGLLKLGQSDGRRARMLAHQPLQHEGEQRQRIGLARDLLLQLLHHRGIEHRRLRAGLAA